MYKLTDLIWEFTSRCNKNCLYCGSKDILNSEDDLCDKHLLILDEILSQKDLKFLTITGGEPAIDNTLPEIVEKINNKRPDINVRILTNGLFFIKESCVKLLDNDSNGIGVSVNTIDDIKYIKELLSNVKDKDKNKITMVTNFGNHNFNDFFYLRDFSKNFGLWQVQLTIDDKLQLSSDKIIELYNLTSDAIANIVKADNFNNCDCIAGKKSCSITYAGEVIPCLSFRSWRKNLDVQGVIQSKGDLSKIWNDEFRLYRQSCKCICCKDITRICNILSDNFISKKYNTQFSSEDNFIKKSPKNDMIIAVYSVRINNDFNTPTC